MALTIDKMHPYYQKILDIYKASGRLTYDKLIPKEAREMLRTSLAAAPPQQDLPELAFVIDETVTGSGGPIPVRRYQPRGEIRGTCLYMHAGGWVIGDLDTGDALCRRLAAGAGCEVISVDYRLAPEHPFPAAVNDVFDVCQWAIQLHDEPIVLVGESSGGNLAAAVALRLAEAGESRLTGQVLAYPVTDHDFDSASYQELGAKNYLLSEPEMRWFWNQYCPPEQRDHSWASPLRATNMQGLPPALVYVAQLDPLRSEGLAYANRLAGEGIEVQTRCDPGMLHGYLSAAGTVPLAAEAVAQAARWIRFQMARSGH